MYSQAVTNTRQTPKLASPSANIAGSQTNKFIRTSFYFHARMKVLCAGNLFRRLKSARETHISICAVGVKERARRPAISGALQRHFAVGKLFGRE